MMVNVAINGFGRIGRIFFRQAFNHPDLEIVAINDLGDKENLIYLAEHDSVYGKYKGKVSIKNGKLIVNGKKIQILQEKNHLSGMGRP